MVMSWTGGKVEQIVPNLDKGNSVHVDVELSVMRMLCSDPSAPCTKRFHNRPSVRAAVPLSEVYLQGSKNSESLRVGNGKSMDSLGCESHPLGVNVGNRDQQNTFLVEEGKIIGNFFYGNFWTQISESHS